MQKSQNTQPWPPRFSKRSKHRKIMLRCFDKALSLSKTSSIPALKTYDCPSGAVDGSSSANAGDTGSIPGPGRFHTPRSNEAHEWQLLKPTPLEPGLHNRRSHRREKPRATTGESPRAAMKTQCHQERYILKKKNYRMLKKKTCNFLLLMG